MNTKEITGELSRENMFNIFTRKKITVAKKNIKVKWFGISLVFI